ncbi:MAG: sensor domain-containing diguanylate cyclase, partial [Actinomycetota bacterium]
MSRFTPTRISEAWARVDRYRRLNFAVLSCLVVMFGLVLSLIGAVRWLDAYSEARLGESGAFDEARLELLSAATELERFETGSTAARQELSVLRDALAARVLELGDDFPAETAELERLVRDMGAVIDSESGVMPGAVLINGTVQRAESLAEQFVANAEAQVTDVESTLSSWFQMMQIVAGIASIVFLIVVFTAILPLSRSIERSLNRLQNWRERAARETARRTLSVQVTDGLDVADDEQGAYAVLSRAMEIAAPDHAAEILLADSSKAHLRAVVEHPTNGSAGCGVSSPWSCPAVRRGSTMVFDDSDAIRSCPHLAAHAEPCSAVCSPLTFMGQPMGVLHAVGPVGETPAKELVEDLTTVAGEAATRIGTLRAFAKAELQASTDVLTGLPNRRSIEERVRQIVADGNGGAIVLLELDGLIELNDRLGKAAGDRAVTAVADALQLAARPDDDIGRWAGAEFIAVLADQTAAEASAIGRRFCDEAAAALERAELSGVSVLSGFADTRLADSVRELLNVANDSLA